MQLEIVVVSEKCAPSESETKRLREELGFQVFKHRGRYWASKPVADLESVVAVWGKQIFQLPDGASGRPYMLGVRFNDVTCASVVPFIDGYVGRVIMVDPSDPLHTSLFAFAVAHYPSQRMIEVRMERAQADFGNNAELLLSVLRVCAKQFYVPGKRVQFHDRKNVRRAKRRYLLWLEREKKLSSGQGSAAWTDIESNMHAKGQTVGDLKDADGVWERMVQREVALQKDSEN